MQISNRNRSTQIVLRMYIGQLYKLHNRVDSRKCQDEWMILDSVVCACSVQHSRLIVLTYSRYFSDYYVVIAKWQNKKSVMYFTVSILLIISMKWVSIFVFGGFMILWIQTNNWYFTIYFIYNNSHFTVYFDYKRHLFLTETLLT